jgi:LuxR family transcriptional regulator, maltose regulon positive regulatory protein
VSLDESDDDPVRFWVYVIEAFRVVVPGFGEAALGVLQGSGSADVLTQVVLPQLLNEFATSGSESRWTTNASGTATTPCSRSC